VVERKLATVLFVDLVDSTGLVAASDPEVVRRRVTEYFARAARCIEQHGGTVEKFAGDAVMAAFGVPVAHEDHAERALHAALSMRSRLKEVFGERLALRVGVNTGDVVVGANRAVSPKTMTIITDTPGFTAQIKAGDSATGPFHTVANSRTIASTTATFSLNGGGRYFLVWITNLGDNDQVRIDEVKAR